MPGVEPIRTRVTCSAEGLGRLHRDRATRNDFIDAVLDGPMRHGRAGRPERDRLIDRKERSA